MKARDRAMREALRLAEDLQDKEASGVAEDSLDPTQRQGREATWQQISSKLSAPVGDDGFANEGYEAAEPPRLGGRHRHEDARQELLAKLAASVSASGDTQAMRDLDKLMRDMKLSEDTAEASAGVEDPLAVAEMESKALKEESVRELEKLRRSALADQVSLVEGGGTAATSPDAAEMEVAVGTTQGLDTGYPRPTRSRSVNRLLQLARDRRTRAAARARRRSLEDERLLRRDDDGSGEPIPWASRATGLTDVTRQYRGRLANDLAANVRSVQDDAFSTSAGSWTSVQDLGSRNEDGQSDPLLSNAGAEVQLEREADDAVAAECRSKYECDLEVFKEKCASGMCVCVEGKCQLGDDCNAKGCDGGKICTKHGKAFVCQDPIESAYPQQQREEDVGKLQEEIENMRKARDKLQAEAKEAFDKMKEYHTAIHDLTEPMKQMKEEAARAETNYATQILAHEQQRTQPLDDLDKEDTTDPDSLLQDLEFTLNSLKDTESGGE